MNFKWVIWFFFFGFFALLLHITVFDWKVPCSLTGLICFEFEVGTINGRTPLSFVFLSLLFLETQTCGNSFFSHVMSFVISLWRGELPSGKKIYINAYDQLPQMICYRARVRQAIAWFSIGLLNQFRAGTICGVCVRTTVGQLTTSDINQKTRFPALVHNHVKWKKRRQILNKIWINV